LNDAARDVRLIPSWNLGIPGPFHKPIPWELPMRRIWILSLALLAGCTEAAETLPGWTTDYEAAVNASKRSQRPLLLDFGATWCGPCKKLEATTFKDREVSATIQNGYVAVKIDVDRNPELAAKFGVKAYPTIVLVAPDGREIARRSGYVEPGPFLQWITPHRSRNIAEAKPEPVALASLDQSPRCQVVVKTAPGEFDRATREAEARLAERYRMLAARSADAGQAGDAAAYRRKAEELAPQ
jgi:thioredoxin-like negative regulator of GroEL